MKLKVESGRWIVLRHPGNEPFRVEFKLAWREEDVVDPLMELVLLDEVYRPLVVGTPAEDEFDLVVSM